MQNSMDYFPLSVEQYLASERDSPVRHEYMNGYVHAMVGGSRRHNLLTVALARLLGNHLQGTGCQVYVNDMKVKAGSQNDQIYFYPDVMVSCSHQKQDDYTEYEPMLIVEVLSPSTEHFDRLAKLEAYTKIPSLKEYLLVDQQNAKMDLYQRVGEQWALSRYDAEDVVQLCSIELAWSVGVVYQEVEGVS